MVEILHYEPVNKNKTIGYADIRVQINKPTVLIFRKVAHIQSGDRRWFNLPNFSREKADGSPSYLKFCEFETQAYNNQLLECLPDKVKAYCMEHGIAEIESMDFDSSSGFKDELPF